jgi:peptidoglycan/xylan/chitin deacetylase (PgdA/CDA1 family)
MSIGVHTANHVDLVQSSAAVAKKELRDCVTDVQREIGYVPVHFSFPYNNCSDQVRSLLDDFGFHSGVASGSNCLITGTTNRFELPRLDPPSSMALFRFWTSGAYPGLPRALVGRA